MGCIKHSKASWAKKVILPLYLVVVQPHLEYCVQFWLHNIKKMLSIRGGATKLAKGLEDRSCEVRLDT